MNTDRQGIALSVFIRVHLWFQSLLRASVSPWFTLYDLPHIGGVATHHGALADAVKRYSVVVR